MNPKIVRLMLLPLQQPSFTWGASILIDTILWAFLVGGLIHAFNHWHSFNLVIHAALSV
jgi:hypothetical protein